MALLQISEPGKGTLPHEHRHAVGIDLGTTNSLIASEMMPFYQSQYGNPASNHRFGRKALTAIEEAREKVANAVNAHPSQVIFTASGTESNNTIIQGIADSYPDTHFGYSAIEHPCVSQPIISLAKKGFSSTAISVSQDGLVPWAGQRVIFSAIVKDIRLANEQEIKHKDVGESDSKHH